MSYPPPGDPNQPPQYPAGQPPQYPTGQPPQPQQPTSGPPGSYPTGSGYGHEYGSNGYTAHMERPGTVTAGSVIAIVLSGLSAITAAAALVGAIVAWGPLIDEFRADPSQYELTTDQIDQIADAQAGVIITVVVWLVIAVLGVALGMMTMKGQNWARITMTVFAAISALLALLLITSVVSALWLLGSIACIICVYVGGANDWFRYRKQSRQAY